MLGWQDLVLAVVGGLGGMLGIQLADSLVGRHWPGLFRQG
jgi:hypothetical protein